MIKRIREASYDEDLDNLNIYIDNAMDTVTAPTKRDAVHEICRIASDYFAFFPESTLSLEKVLSQINYAFRDYGAPYIRGGHIDELIDTYNQIAFTESTMVSKRKKSLKENGRLHLKSWI